MLLGESDLQKGTRMLIFEHVLQKGTRVLLGNSDLLFVEVGHKLIVHLVSRLVRLAKLLHHL